MKPCTPEQQGALAQAIAAATDARADNLEAACQLAAKRGDALQAMLARAETRGREIARELAQSRQEMLALRSGVAPREAVARWTADGGTPRGARLKGAPPEPRSNLPGWLAQCLEQLGGRVKAVEMQALRDRSPTARELLARLASGGHMDYEALLGFVHAATRAPALLQSASLLEVFNPDAVRSLASVVGNQNLGAGDGIAAIELFRFVTSAFGHEEMSRAAMLLFVDLLTRAGEISEAQSLLKRFRLENEAPVDYACLLANTLHPANANATGPAPRNAWLATVNTLFTPCGLEAVNLAEGELPLLSRLECPLRAGTTTVEGPLVSVLMTTYEPDRAVATAIRSVLEQSWRNLELIITDDASSEQSYALLRELARTDTRIVLLRNDRNQGTYIAKNRGLSVARGEFVTCHDSDDWSHPRKIERQVGHLLGKEHVVGNFSFWVRATSDLVFQRFIPGDLRYPNTSSLMFRRKSVLERCGYWDGVRVGADTEYCRRIEAAFGHTLPRLSGSVLSFGQIREGSLTASGSDGMSRGWMSPRRLNYRAAWRYWHKSVKAAGGSLCVPQQGVRRPFPAPEALLPQRFADGHTRRGTHDVVIVSDFRSDGASLAGEIRAAAAGGKRIALCHVNSFQANLIHSESIDPCIQELLHDGMAGQVVLDDEIDCGLLLVHDARVLQFLAAPRSGIEAGKLRIVAGARAGQDSDYDVDTCTRVAERVFGGEASWLPGGPLARAMDDGTAGIAAVSG